MHELDDLILQYRDRLSISDKNKLDSKIKNISGAKEYFLEHRLAERFKNQENLMENLERDFWKKYKSYKNGFINKWKNTGRHIDKNLAFWPEEIMQPQRDKLESAGLKQVEKLFNNSSKYTIHIIQLSVQYEPIDFLVSQFITFGESSSNSKDI